MAVRNNKWWANKRAANLERMTKEARKTDEMLFRHTSTALHAAMEAALAAGDDVYADHLCTLANLHDFRARTLKDKKG